MLKSFHIKSEFLKYTLIIDTIVFWIHEQG